MCGALIVVPAASAVTQPGGYADERAVTGAIESQGITYAGTHKEVSRGQCRGLTHYGVRHVGSVTAYHRLHCDLIATDRQVFEAEVVVVSSSTTSFSWRILSGKRRI